MLVTIGSISIRDGNHLRINMVNRYCHRYIGAKSAIWAHLIWSHQSHLWNRCCTVRYNRATTQCGTIQCKTLLGLSSRAQHMFYRVFSNGWIGLFHIKQENQQGAPISQISRMYLSYSHMARFFNAFTSKVTAASQHFIPWSFGRRLPPNLHLIPAWIKRKINSTTPHLKQEHTGHIFCLWHNASDVMTGTGSWDIEIYSRVDYNRQVWFDALGLQQSTKCKSPMLSDGQCGDAYTREKSRRPGYEVKQITASHGAV